MKRVRWLGEGNGWELDMSTPVTLEGIAVAVPGDPLPLGVSRGTRLARPKQLDFFHRFMSLPFLPSFSAFHGLSLHRVLSIPLPNPCFATLLANFRPLRLASELDWPASASAFFHDISRRIRDTSLYAFDFSSEFWLSPDDTLLFSYESPYGGNPKEPPAAKAVFHHKFPDHDLTAEIVWPGLFVDNRDGYWNVPFSASLALASVPAESGPGYHLCLRHNRGSPTKFDGDKTSAPPPSLLPGLSVKTAFAYKHNLDIWRGNSQKLKMIQPFDVFLSNPHVSVSGSIGIITSPSALRCASILYVVSSFEASPSPCTPRVPSIHTSQRAGAAMAISFSDTSTEAQLRDASQGFRGFFLHAPAIRSGFLADAFARISFTAQHGNFQRLFSDLTRFQARLDFPSGVGFLSGVTSLAQDLLNSRQPDVEAVQAICPSALFALQQQIAGPFSFRVESRVLVDLKDREKPVRIDDPVFAVEYALQVLGSAKAFAWYSPKHKEFMVELRFFEA